MPLPDRALAVRDLDPGGQAARIRALDPGQPAERLEVAPPDPAHVAQRVGVGVQDVARGLAEVAVHRLRGVCRQAGLGQAPHQVGEGTRLTPPGGHRLRDGWRHALDRRQALGVVGDDGADVQTEGLHDARGQRRADAGEAVGGQERDQPID